MNLIGKDVSKGGASKSNRLGFTLVEVMIGVAILALAIVSLFALLAYGFTLVQLNRDNLRATQIMLNRIEGLRLYNWEQLTVGNMIQSPFTETYSGVTGSGQGTVFTGEVKLGDAISGLSYSGHMRAVTVSVTWTSGKLQHTRQMTTYVSEYGLQNYVFAN